MLSPNCVTICWTRKPCHFFGPCAMQVALYLRRAREKMEFALRDTNFTPFFFSILCPSEIGKVLLSLEVLLGGHFNRRDRAGDQ